MAKTSLTLAEHLFEVLENVTDTSIKGKELEEHLRRADAASKIATQIINGGNLSLKMAQLAKGGAIGPDVKERMKMITG